MKIKFIKTAATTTQLLLNKYQCGASQIYASSPNLPHQFKPIFSGMNLSEINKKKKKKLETARNRCLTYI